jgi:hypothetical protein
MPNLAEVLSIFSRREIKSSIALLMDPAVFYHQLTYAGAISVNGLFKTVLSTTAVLCTI